MVTKFSRGLRKIVPVSFRFPETGNMGNQAIGFEREHKVRRHEVHPPGVRLGGGHMVEGVIDLSRLKSAG